MQPEMYQQEPNLVAEAYRNQINNQNQDTRRLQKQYDFIDINNDGNFLLGTSNLSGRVWNGSIWVFGDPQDPPDVDKCLAGMEFETGVAVGRWYDGGTKIAIGTDFGELHLIFVVPMTDSDRQYLTTWAVLCEHDDGITTLDPSYNGSKILTGGMDMCIKVWDSEAGVSDKTYECAHTNTVTSAAFHPQKDHVFISTSTDGNTLIWDMNDDKPASLVMDNGIGYTASAWIDDNCVAVGATSGTVSLLDLRMKSELDRVVCSKRPIFHIKYQKESEFLAVCADDEIVRVYQHDKKRLNNVYECERHSDFVRGLTWKSPNNLYSCAWDSKILHHEIIVKDGNNDLNNMDLNSGEKTVKDEK